MREPGWGGEREQVQLEPAVLTNRVTFLVTSLRDRHDKVPAPARSRRRAVVRGEESTALVSPVNLE